MDLEAKRAELRAKIPANYNGKLHFITLNTVSLTAIAIGLANLGELAWWDWAFVPGFFAFANFFEWAYHRWPLHTPGYIREGYLSHAKCHHILFTDDAMPMEEWNDLNYTLFHPFFLVIILCIVLPVGLLLGALISPNLLWLSVISGYGYYWVYEWLHTLHHFPQGFAFAETPFVNWLREHHARHHNIRQMTRGNFNVSFPLADYIIGSVLPDGRKQSAKTPEEATP